MIRGGGSLGRAAAVAIAAGLAAGWVTRHLTRYEVAGESMHPTLRAGEYVVASRRGPRGDIRRGEIVLAQDPRDPSRVIVKRVAAVGPAGVWLAGDNPAASTDSREFGAIAPEAVIGRVLAVYWPPGSMRLVR